MLYLHMTVTDFSVRCKPSIHTPGNVASETANAELALTESLLREFHLDGFFTRFEFGLLN